MADYPLAQAPGGDRLFQTTHWTVVLAAGEQGQPAANAALEQLCRAYWYPVYVYVRRSGHGPHDAEDLTQEFFFRLLERRDLAQADPQKGRFRNFLLVAVRHFLANQWDRAKAVKRGGRVRFISVDQAAGSAETWEPCTHDAPDRAFARTWALVFLERVMARLRTEFESAEQRRQFDELKVFLAGGQPGETYAQVAARLETTTAAIKMAVQRLRRRFAKVLREEIAHTVSRPDEVEDEIRCLFAATSS